jgi:hypothetical protein
LEVQREQPTVGRTRPFTGKRAGQVSAFLQHARLIAGALTNVVAAVSRPALARGHAAALYATLTPTRDVR